MTGYVALLRAVNVGGTGKLPMTALAQMCEAIGFEKVKTYIASGNAVFQTGGSEDQVRSVMEDRLQAYAGKSVDVIVRNTELAAMLEELAVTDLVIVGMATEFCVDTTIRSSLARNFKTIVPEDGHTTADRPHLPAARVIEHHNATWPWLVSPVGGATMTRCADIVSLLDLYTF